MKSLTLPDLNADCLSLVFDSLDLVDEAQAESVCKRFRGVLASPRVRWTVLKPEFRPEA